MFSYVARVPNGLTCFCVEVFRELLRKSRSDPFDGRQKVCGVDRGAWVVLQREVFEAVFGYCVDVLFGASLWVVLKKELLGRLIVIPVL